jgi:preprotein translocase SecE subunit
VPALAFSIGNQAVYLLPIVTLAISVALAEVIRRNSKANEYGVDVVVETKKVTWPNRKELQGSTLIVIVMSLVATVIIFALDKIFETAIRFIF